MTLTMLWGHGFKGNTSTALPNKPPSPMPLAWISEKENAKLWNEKFGKILGELTRLVGPRVGRLLDDGPGVTRNCQNSGRDDFSAKFVWPMSVGWVLPCVAPLFLITLSPTTRRPQARVSAARWANSAKPHVHFESQKKGGSPPAPTANSAINSVAANISTIVLWIVRFYRDLWIKSIKDFFVFLYIVS